MTRRKFSWPILMLALLILVIFHSAFFSEFVVWDDDHLLIDNWMLRLPFFEFLRTAFSVYYHGDYLPVTLLNYWIDLHTFGLNASLEHAENLILHTANTLLLFVFLRRFTENEMLSLVVSVVFAIHPLQVEPVLWVSERKSLLSAFFTFLVLNVYLQTHTGRTKKLRSNLILAMLLFVLAGLTKASSLLLPVLLILIDLKQLGPARTSQFGPELNRIFRRVSPFFALAAALILVRIQAYVSGVGTFSENALSPDRLMQVPLMSLNAIRFYIQKFFVPLHLSAIYPDYQIQSTVVLTSLLVFFGLAFTGFLVWKRRAVVPAFFYLWFLLFLLPVLQIFPRINYVNDRYMYLPIVGLVGLILSLLPHLTLESVQSRWRERVLMAALVAVMLPLSYTQAQVWKTNRSLWTHTTQVFSESLIARNNLAIDYQMTGEFDRAVTLYQEILANGPESPGKLLAYNNLASLFANEQFKDFDLDKAKQFLLEGLSKVVRPRDGYDLRIKLGMVLETQRNVQDANATYASLLQDLRKEPDSRFQTYVSFLEEKLKGH